MTDNISFREFMELVEKRIEGCTRESLRDIRTKDWSCCADTWE